ncbi:MAG: hypothetical protein Q4E39_01810 [bacterium]|nr:hypothetical protein [bacterium]
MKNKRYIYIIVLLFISISLFLIFYGINIIKDYNKDEILIVSDNIFRKYKSKWFKIQDIKSMNWKKFHIYVNNDYYGDKYLYYNEKWYIFEKDRKALTYSGDILAFNTDYKVLKFNEVNNYLDENIKRVLNENNSEEVGIEDSYYIDVDIDGDNSLERIYVVTNRFSEKLDSGKFFSYVFLLKNNKITYIYKESSKDNNSYSGCKPYVNNIIDVDDDGKYEVILACSYYSYGSTKYNLFKYNKGKFNLLVSN